MYTKCPTCQTFFRINSAQLKAAAGKVRCCQCNQVFNALENLQERAAFVQNEAHDEAPEYGIGMSQSELIEESLFADTLNLDSDQLIDNLHAPGPDNTLVSDTQDEVLVEMNDGLESEPDYLAADSESQMSELLGHDSSNLSATEEEAPAAADVIPLKAADADIAGIGEPDQSKKTPRQSVAAVTTKGKKKYPSLLLDRQDDQSTAPQQPDPDFPLDEMFDKQSLSFVTLAWGLGSLLLVIVLLVQITWLMREQVIQTDLGQPFLGLVCKIAGCQAPQRRDTSKIIIQHRDLRAHPDKPNALYLSLNMINRADFRQPYPKLQLSLFNDSEKLIARRTFLPEEYLRESQLQRPLMPSSQVVDVVMELVDPGKDLTGFKFEFL